MQWFWLSFADGHLPEGEQFLGVAIIPVDEQVIDLIVNLDYSDRIERLRERGQENDVPFYVAVQYARFLGLNPGGEAQGYEITEAISRVDEKHRCKLLSKEELEETGLMS